MILSNSSTATSGDVRGWRIALVPDALLNPPESADLAFSADSKISPVMIGLNVLGAIDTNGYGVLQIPPPGHHGPLLAVIADQIAEYSHHGYAVVAIGIQGDPGGLHWRRLVSLLRQRGAAPPPRHLILPRVDVALEGQRLNAFLSNYDLSAEERRHWRV